MNIKDIKSRLEELDRMETQIQFSADFLTPDDRVRLSRIHDEQRELKEQLKELEGSNGETE